MTSLRASNESIIINGKQFLGWRFDNGAKKNFENIFYIFYEIIMWWQEGIFWIGYVNFIEEKTENNQREMSFLCSESIKIHLNDFLKRKFHNEKFEREYREYYSIQSKKEGEAFWAFLIAFPKNLLWKSHQKTFSGVCERNLFYWFSRLYVYKSTKEILFLSHKIER